MIPTAKEFFKTQPTNRHGNLLKPEESLIEFTELHVKAALKEASEQAYVSDTVFCEIDRDSILNAYPLENIK